MRPERLVDARHSDSVPGCQRIAANTAASLPRSGSAEMIHQAVEFHFERRTDYNFRIPGAEPRGLDSAVFQSLKRIPSTIRKEIEVLSRSSGPLSCATPAWSKEFVPLESVASSSDSPVRIAQAGSLVCDSTRTNSRASADSVFDLASVSTRDYEPLIATNSTLEGQIGLEFSADKTSQQGLIGQFMTDVRV